jgi:hypothetical protein
MKFDMGHPLRLEKLMGPIFFILGFLVGVGVFVLMLLLMAKPAKAERLNPEVTFAWDGTPDCTTVDCWSYRRPNDPTVYYLPDWATYGYFELTLCGNGTCQTVRVTPGTARHIRTGPLNLPGDLSATVRACYTQVSPIPDVCSGPSNTVVWDRTAPLPPAAISWGHNDR